LKLPDAGQYRVSFKLTDNAKHTVEGAAIVLVVLGEGNDGRDCRFNDIELTTDRTEYAVGDKVKLLVNTDKPDATVLLFLRPIDGVYLEPKLLKLKGKSLPEEIEVLKEDMPNFFVEAMTIRDGQVHTAVREVFVPPVDRVVNVEVQSARESYKPGEMAAVKIKVTGLDGKTCAGTTAITVYDKSLEYISNGSNLSSIKEFFWKWRRRHESSTKASLSVGPGNGRRDAVMTLQVRRTPRQFGAPTDDEYALRKDFADTACWSPSLTIDKDGLGEIRVRVPDNLSTWKIKVWAMGYGTRVGEGEASFVSKKDLILRAQAPRFFVQKDEVILSANVHNYLKTDKLVNVSLELDGPTSTCLGEKKQQVMIKSGGEQRVVWRVAVKEEGQAVVRMKAVTDEESDAMEMRFPVYVHGMLKMDSFSGVVRPNQDSGTVTFKVPEQRRPEQSRVEVRYSPTLAGAMVDALPYLVDYPFGCTEQTLNRFVPAAITHKVLTKMNLDLADIHKKRVNLNSQEIGDDPPLPPP